MNPVDGTIPNGPATSHRRRTSGSNFENAYRMIDTVVQVRLGMSTDTTHAPVAVMLYTGDDKPSDAQSAYDFTGPDDAEVQFHRLWGVS